MTSTMSEHPQRRQPPPKTFPYLDIILGVAASEEPDRPIRSADDFWYRVGRWNEILNHRTRV